MTEKDLKAALDQIEPEAGAQDRMHANILKKAASRVSAPAERSDAAASERGENTNVAPQPVRRPAPVWKRCGAMAACLALAATVTLGFLSPFLTRGGEADAPPLMGGSPFEDVSGPEAFEVLGFTIDAPEGAENPSYCIYDGAIARVDFTLDGNSYTYEAAKLDGNFSRADGDAIDSISLNAEYGAALDRISSDVWRAHWSRDSIRYYLTNFDGAEEASVAAVAQTLMECK